MKLISIKEAYWTLCHNVDSEVLEKNRRPYVLVLRLKYNSKNYDFAIPIRSNIPCSEQKDLFFSLPPRNTTKPGKRHGLHFKKMIPVNKQCIDKYYISQENHFDVLIQNKIGKEIKQIVTKAQAYLVKYENGDRAPYSTDIDKLLCLINDEFK